MFWIGPSGGLKRDILMVEADCWPGCQTSLSREVPRAKSDEACFAWLPYILVRVSLLKRLAYCISGEMREREREKEYSLYVLQWPVEWGVLLPSMGVCE